MLNLLKICINAIKKRPRYEVRSLMTHEKYLDERLKKAQDEGWELAGNVLIKNSTGHCTDTYFHIPLKRIVSA